MVAGSIMIIKHNTNASCRLSSILFPMAYSLPSHDTAFCFTIRLANVLSIGQVHLMRAGQDILLMFLLDNRICSIRNSVRVANFGFGHS